MVLMRVILGDLIALAIMAFLLRRSWGWLRIAGVVLVVFILIDVLFGVIAK